MNHPARYAFLTLAAAAAFAAPAAAQQRVEYLNSNPQAAQSRPFSEAVRVGDILYLSGALGTRPGAGLAEGGITAETTQALENIKATLERHGSSIDRVVKCTVMLTDMADFRAMSDAYVKFFPTNRPARSAFAVAGLAANAKVEIECIAAAG
jgi:reactive intermediate/imine deaminase